MTISNPIPQWKYDYLVNEWRGVRGKSHESAIIGMLMHDPALSELRPETQRNIKCSNNQRRLIDLYYPQVNVAVEIDEHHHRGPGAKEHDSRREAQIQEVFECESLRIRLEDGDVPNQIRTVRDHLLNRMSEKLGNGTWCGWEEPRHFNFEELRQASQNTLFVKINDRQDNETAEDFYLRQTGTWSFDESKFARLNRAVVVANGSGRIISVFELTSESSFERQDDGKWRFHGNSIIDPELDGAFIRGWSNQTTRRYSGDIVPSAELETEEG